MNGVLGMDKMSKSNPGLMLVSHSTLSKRGLSLTVVVALVLQLQDVFQWQIALSVSELLLV